MTEDEARGWIADRFGALAEARIASFLDLVAHENARQNLVAPSTVPHLWSRHAMDSAQLLSFDRAGLWVDIGTGGGFPGVIVALLRAEPVLLVEVRKRRAEFLRDCATTLELHHVQVLTDKIENVARRADIISARAVASIEKLLQIASGCAKESTRWLLPRGRLNEADRVWVAQHWQGVFHMEQSLTDPDSTILVLDGACR